MKGCKRKRIQLVGRYSFVQSREIENPYMSISSMYILDFCFTAAGEYFMAPLKEIVLLEFRSPSFRGCVKMYKATVEPRNMLMLPVIFSNMTLLWKLEVGEGRCAMLDYFNIFCLGSFYICVLWPPDKIPKTKRELYTILIALKARKSSIWRWSVGCCWHPF